MPLVSITNMIHGENELTDKIVWSGKTSSYHHKWNDTPNPEGTQEGVRKVWLLDAQWSTCPIEVEDQVRQLWRYYENDNDRYIIKTTIETLEKMIANEAEVEDFVGGEQQKVPLKVNAIIQYLEEMGVGRSDQVLIHWWW